MFVEEMIRTRKHTFKKYTNQWKHGKTEFISKRQRKLFFKQTLFFKQIHFDRMLENGVNVKH